MRFIFPQYILLARSLTKWADAVGWPATGCIAYGLQRRGDEGAEPVPGAKLVEWEPPAIPEHHQWLEPSPRVTLGGRTGQEHRNIISTYAVVSVFRATYTSKT